MEVFKAGNLLVRFMMELCMLAAVGYWGFKMHSGWSMKIVLGIGLPVLIAVIWGAFISPKAAYPLRGLSRLFLELILFGSGALALYASGQISLAWIYTAVLIFNEILIFAWDQ